MKPLKKGDPVKVRLHTGDVVEAIYYMPSQFNEKCHILNDGDLLAIGGYTLNNRRMNGNTLGHECVFVGSPCILVPVEDRV